MKRYGAVVIGAGDVGAGIAFRAAAQGLDVALIDKGNVGGTCLNNGCVPSKTLIHSADRIVEIREAIKLGIRAKIGVIDFSSIMGRMRSVVANGRDSLREAIEGTENIDFYGRECHFIDDHTVEAGGVRIRGKKIFIASGSRPLIPPIRGLDAVRFLTNESVLDLEKRPESMIMIGGGYIGLEYAHFFSAVGTRVIVVDRGATLLPFEEPEISELLKRAMSRRVEMHTGREIVEVKRSDKGCAVVVRNRSTGETEMLSAETVMVATGRKSNADLLRVEKAGIETNEANYIKVNDYLLTNRKHIWAVGDAIGKAMFTHAGDREAEIAWHNATHGKKIKMDFGSVPHAVFTFPQIASVGLTEEQARKNHEVLVGRASYSDTVMGTAMAEEEGFAKAIVGKDTGRILGFHIIGPYASMLIPEVVNAVINRSKVESVTRCMHIFPALSDLITETLGNLE